MTDMGNKKSKNKIVLIIILAVTFGLISGIVGELVARTYLFGSSFRVPYFGEINLSENQGNGTNVVISGVRKVSVKQNDKVIDTANAVDYSLVGVFRKIKATQATNFDIKNYYQVGQAVAQGLIITSDGWIITNFTETHSSSEINIDYVIITSDKKIYEVEKIIYDKLSNFSFIKVEAKDLPVRKFVSKNEVGNGQIVLSVNVQKKIWLSTIASIEKIDTPPVYFSDEIFETEIKLVDQLNKDFNSVALFNLSGDVTALIDKAGLIKPINDFTSTILNLLKGQGAQRASLGVYYVDLSDLVGSTIENGMLIYKGDKGLSVIKGSAAELAGLEEGDIIISIDNIIFNKNNSLSSVISQHIAGDEIFLVFLRNGQRGEINLRLGAL